MSDIVKHFMWKDGESIGKPITGFGPKDVDIEKRWPGIKYSKCNGLTTKGQRKNIHIEEYSDSNELRIWQGDDVIREATDIVFSFFFTGEYRQVTYDDFIDYCSNGKIHYWDTMRKREAIMVLVDKTEPKEDIYKGSIPYIYIEIKFKNLRGECPIKNIEGL